MVRADCREAPASKQPRENSFSAKEPSGLLWISPGALAKILQRLAGAGLLLSHHGIRVGTHWYVTRTRFPLLDVIRASEGVARTAYTESTGAIWSRFLLQSTAHVSEIVEDALRRVTIADLKEQASGSSDSRDAQHC